LRFEVSRIVRDGASAIDPYRDDASRVSLVGIITAPY
jgi:hypothetical protein